MSITSLVGGFFRELVDVENGFWPTFVGLTLRPGKTLQRYLSGVRKGLISPGRYAVAAVVVFVGADQLKSWIGTEPPPVADPYMMSTNGKRDAFDASVAYLIPYLEQTPVAFFLLIAMPLAFSLWTLFRDQLRQESEALAVGSFLLAHTIFLFEGLTLISTGMEFLFTVSPAGLSLSTPVGVFGFSLMAAYVGFACRGCFGPGWKAALKGAFCGGWAWVEMFATIVLTVTAIGVWLWKAYPGAYYAFEPGNPQEAQLGFLLFGTIFSMPLLLHAGVEVYYRLR